MHYFLEKLGYRVRFNFQYTKSHYFFKTLVTFQIKAQNTIRNIKQTLIYVVCRKRNSEYYILHQIGGIFCSNSRETNIIFVQKLLQLQTKLLFCSQKDLSSSTFCSFFISIHKSSFNPTKLEQYRKEKVKSYYNIQSQTSSDRLYKSYILLCSIQSRFTALLSNLSFRRRTNYSLNLIHILNMPYNNQTKKTPE